MIRFIISFLIIFSKLYSQDINKNYPLQIALIGNFVTSSNDTIQNCFITFRTFGKVNLDSSNIIFYPTWLGGNSESIGTLLSKYAYLDTNKFFIIAIDALGNGFSSSPSNTLNFPQITFDDMTKAYFIVLTKHLKLKKVYAIVGGSMGGMTAFEFAIKFPHFADKIVAYVSSPELSSYDLLWINSQINLIEHLNQLKSPLKNIKAYSDMLTALIARTPEYLNENVKTSEFKDYFNKFYKEPDTIYTLDNYLAQLKAISTYNLSKDLNAELDIITNRIKAKLLIIVSETDMMVNPASSIKLAKNMNAELFILKNNCGHLAVSCEIEKVREIINNFLSKNNSVK